LDYLILQRIKQYYKLSRYDEEGEQDERDFLAAAANFADAAVFTATRPGMATAAVHAAASVFTKIKS
jgi:hypothetical protein